MRRCSLLIAPEIRPLDEGDQIEYASARFEAAAVVAAERKKKPIREGDGGNENNRNPPRDRDREPNRLSRSNKKSSIGFLPCSFLLVTSHLTAWEELPSLR